MFQKLIPMYGKLAYCLLILMSSNAFLVVQEPQWSFNKSVAADMKNVP